MAITTERMGGGGGRFGRQRRRPMSEINVTPFVDVMLVLLIIFMVTAPLLTVGVEINLPETKAGAIAGEDEPLAISITEAGEIFLQDTSVPLDTLVPRLRAITGENRELRIFVRGDANINYGRVMEVMGTINRAGYRRVALITRSGEKSDKSAGDETPKKQQ
ncbi:MAG: protein TolR [Rhodospirillales bacterium]|nr:protein TolR [Rhodospirillales bacterium]MBO6787483.1 protein TolR [Rhodospirillales bacterium]